MARGSSDAEYVTPGEAARMLHVSPKTVNRWAQQGRIPCLVTLGGHRRFKRDDVMAAVKQMEQGRPAEPGPAAAD